MLNKVIIQGNLTKAPNIKYIGSNNTPITESSIASNDNSPSGTTLFIDFVFWGDKAESFSKFFTIGNEVIITGKLKLETWNDQSGKSQRRYKIIGDSFEFTRGGTKPSNNYQQTSNNYQQANQQTNQQTGNNYQQTDQQNNYQQTGNELNNVDYDDDEIPF